MAEGRAGALEDYATAAFSMSGVKQDIRSAETSRFR